MSTLPTEARETPHLPFGMTAEELLDAVCPSPRRNLDKQGEPVTRPGLTLLQRHALRVYPLLIDAFLGEPVRLSMHEADALLELVDAELENNAEEDDPNPVAAVPTGAPGDNWGRMRPVRMIAARRSQ